jgi:cytosine/adenosine deaminase-related metal-dependent hydrolase
MSILIKNTTIVTMNQDHQVLQGNVLVEQDRIAAIGATVEDADRVIDGAGRAVIPGLIQSHVHLCQTLFRGQANDLELLDWLRLRIWPLEGSHDQESVYYSALLGCGELFKSGTTAIVDMETVHHTDASFEALLQAGMRAISGKCMMDYGDGVPASLLEETGRSIQESVDLLEKWHGKGEGRLQYAFTPRFVISCSDRLLQEVRDLAARYRVKVHTHASENQGEIAEVQRDRGLRNLVYLDRIGLAGPDLILAHCIWLDDQEQEIVARSGIKVAHCPSSNLKLASGIARIPELLSAGASISIGTDSTACNNNLDQFLEMRLAALIHKPAYGATAMPAGQVFELATIGGARAMGLEQVIGSLEVGKKADLAIVDLGGLHNQPQLGRVDIYSQLVYQVNGGDVVTTMVDGRIVMDDRQLKTIDEPLVKAGCNEAIVRVGRRAGVL